MSGKCPKISIVTPSYNTTPRFLEETIISVLAQNYPNFEYVVVDGGSTNGSAETIKKYEAKLAYWVSEPDSGQYEAINKGFAKTTGEIMAWLNSDDKYTPWAFSVVAEIFSAFPEVDWLTTLYPLNWDEGGNAIGCTYIGGFSRNSFFKGANLPGANWYVRTPIQQESTFWRRSLWERAGGTVDASLKFAGDFELWARFFRHSELYSVAVPIAGFRIHPGQKMADHAEAYVREAEAVLRHSGGSPYGKVESLLRRALWDVVGHRPLKRLPASVAWVLCGTGLLERVKVCSRMHGAWTIVTDYVV